MYFKVVRFNSPSNFRSIYDAAEKPIIYTVGEMVESDTPMFIYKFGNNIGEYRSDRHLLQVLPYNVEEINKLHLSNSIYDQMGSNSLKSFWNRYDKSADIIYPVSVSNKIFVKKVYSQEEAEKIVFHSNEIDTIKNECLTKLMFNMNRVCNEL